MSALWQDDTELFALARTELFVAVVGDVLDKMGLQHQFLDPQLKPIDPALVLIGRAMPVLEADFFAERGSGKNPLSSKPFGLMFEALDDLAPGRNLYLRRRITSLRALGRPDVNPCPSMWRGRCGCTRLSPRYEGDFAPRFPGRVVWLL